MFLTKQSEEFLRNSCIRKYSSGFLIIYIEMEVEMQVPLNAYIPAKNYSQHLSMSAFPTFTKTHSYVVVAKLTICQPVLDHIDVESIVVTANVWTKC